MAADPRTHRASAQRRRAALLDAAAELAAEIGAGAVTHRAVAARAGVPLSTTSYFFGSIDELVTEGLALRRLQVDPALEGPERRVTAVLLDEFHERSLDVDLLLALLIDIRSSLRPDLRLLVMSATLQPGPVAARLGDAAIGAVPVITATRHTPHATAAIRANRQPPQTEHLFWRC